MWMVTLQSEGSPSTTVTPNECVMSARVYVSTSDLYVYMYLYTYVR